MRCVASSRGIIVVKLRLSRHFVHRASASHLFVSHHLGAAFTVVEVVSDANHAHGGDVVGGSGLDRASTSQAPKHLDGDGRSLSRVHAVSVAR